MRDTDATIAINTLDSLIAQEHMAAMAGERDGNRIQTDNASTRYRVLVMAKDRIKDALAAAADSDASNPFLCRRDELTTMDMHACDLCGRMCSSPVYTVGLFYGDQGKTASEVCADCMQRLGFQPVIPVKLSAWRDYKRWAARHSGKAEAE